ncbi:MAG: hypothetical protein JSU82_14705 [Rhodospirillales bacterium]|nr:MAG: hypothetical protein JSU82_14705 [Rhodospirillales bacterium]
MTAAAQEIVQARGWAKASYGRIVFDWPRPVEHKATVRGSRLVVEFDRPMRTSLNSVVRGLQDYVTGAQVSDDGMTATFGLAGTFKVDSFVSGTSVVVDLRRAGATAQRLSGQSGAQGLQVRVGQHPGFTRLVFDWADSVDYTVQRRGAAVSLRFDRPGAIDLQILDKALPKPAFGSPSARTVGGDLVVDLVVPDQSYIRHFRDRGKVVLDVLNVGGDFGGLIAGDAVGGPMMEMISPSGEVLTVPAMVGSRVAVAPGGRIPLITEDVGNVPAQAVPYQGSYTPLPHYDPNASGQPRSLLRRTKPSGGRATVNGG